jgi:hypothetical protein
MQWARWWPATGIVFVALWIVAFAITGSSPESNDSDAKILAYYADSGHRTRDMVAFFLVLAALLFFVWFLAVLRDRLVRAEGAVGGLTAAAFGAGLVSAALWMVGTAFFIAPSATRIDTNKFQLNANTFRILNDLGYGVWFSATTIAAVTVVSTAVLSLRTGLLPKWLAWLSFVVAATMLVAFFFIPFLIFLGWVLVVSLILLWKGLAPEPR